MEKGDCAIAVRFTSGHAAASRPLRPTTDFIRSSRIGNPSFVILELDRADTRFGNLPGGNPSHNDTVSRAILRKLCGISGIFIPTFKEPEDGW